MELMITGFIGLRLLDIIDIVLVALLLYELYHLLRGTVAMNIFIGIVAIFLVWRIVSALDMKMLSAILGAFISVGFIALIIIFQPEIRRFLFALGKPVFTNKRKKGLFFWRLSIEDTNKPDIDNLIVACQRMADSREGALIVLSKQNDLEQVVETGEKLDAVVSPALIENIFFKNSPLHDGAMIISHNKIIAAGCILPVSNTTQIPKRLGLRHRAAVGITELSDAVAIVVSEQTGGISYCKMGELSTRVKPAQLKRFLEEEFAVTKVEKPAADAQSL
jgi:diadenylate cyclase